MADKEEEKKRVKVVLISIREMSEDFLEPWMELLKGGGIDLGDDFLNTGQREFAEDYGYTSSEAFYKLLTTEEEENGIRECIAMLRKRNLRTHH
jgi:hypothetical protein